MENGLQWVSKPTPLLLTTPLLHEKVCILEKKTNATARVSNVVLLKTSLSHHFVNSLQHTLLNCLEKFRLQKSSGTTTTSSPRSVSFLVDLLVVSLSSCLQRSASIQASRRGQKPRLTAGARFAQNILLG